MYFKKIYHITIQPYLIIIKSKRLTYFFPFPSCLPPLSTWRLKPIPRPSQPAPQQENQQSTNTGKALQPLKYKFFFPTINPFPFLSYYLSLFLSSLLFFFFFSVPSFFSPLFLHSSFFSLHLEFFSHSISLEQQAKWVLSLFCSFLPFILLVSHCLISPH